MQKQAAYVSGSFPNLNIMFGAGRNFKLCHTGTHHVAFSCFSKEISRILVYLEQDKQQLRPSHIIPVNCLDLDRAYATHEFQVQSKFLYQNSLIQNSGEFKAENQVLEKNYNKATIHHFYSRDYLQSPFIYSILKNRKLDTHFYFVFSFFRSHLTYIYIRQI